MTSRLYAALQVPRSSSSALEPSGVHLAIGSHHYLECGWMWKIFCKFVGFQVHLTQVHPFYRMFNHVQPLQSPIARKNPSLPRPWSNALRARRLVGTSMRLKALQDCPLFDLNHRRSGKRRFTRYGGAGVAVLKDGWALAHEVHHKLWHKLLEICILHVHFSQVLTSVEICNKASVT